MKLLSKGEKCAILYSNERYFIIPISSLIEDKNFIVNDGCVMNHKSVCNEIADMLNERGYKVHYAYNRKDILDDGVYVPVVYKNAMSTIFKMIECESNAFWEYEKRV